MLYRSDPPARSSSPGTLPSRGTLHEDNMSTFLSVHMPRWPRPFVLCAQSTHRSHLESSLYTVCRLDKLRSTLQKSFFDWGEKRKKSYNTFTFGAF